MAAPRFAIVIPSKDEAQNLTALVPEIVIALGDQKAEIVIVDDGSTDDTVAVAQTLGRQYPVVRYVAHMRTRGKSSAIRTGVQFSKAPLIVTMDGDCQNDPRFVMPLLTLAEQPGVGLAAGQRVSHAHTWVKRFSSRFANTVRDLVLKDGTRDSACGLKAFRREVFLRLPFFNGMHRFLPALIIREGLAVRYLDVTDRPRLRGKSKYGVAARAVRGSLDLIRVWSLPRPSTKSRG